MHHKRTTIKISLIVSCCISISATSVNVMDDYSRQSFIQSFTRFSCEFGYPKFMLIDKKGCKTMKDAKQCHCVSRTSKGSFTKI